MFVSLLSAGWDSTNQFSLQGSVKMSWHILVALVYLAVSAHSSGDWCYVDPVCGPSSWAHHYPQCAQFQQSPIDIIPAEADSNLNLGSLQLIGPLGSSLGEIKNNGHTVEVTLSDVYNLRGSGLLDVYKLQGFHLHFGNKYCPNQGSEHTISGQAYPLEIHFVFYNLKYASVEEAKLSWDGLAVVGVLFQIGRQNSALNPLIEQLPNIANKGSSSSLSINLFNLLPSNLDDYYRYRGSLTTPSCNEVVTWTVLSSVQSIGMKQYKDIVSSLYYTDASDEEQIPMTNNFRPTQPLNGRLVLKNNPLAQANYKADI